MKTSLLPFCFLDLETTGHDPLKLINSRLERWHEIIEIGAVVADQSSLEVLGEFSIKIKPEYPERCIPGIVNNYPERAKNGEWDDAVWLFVGLSKFLLFLRNVVPHEPVQPVGQNPSFDWSFLSPALAYCKIPDDLLREYFHYARLDTRSMAVQQLWKLGEPYNPQNYSLRNEKLAQMLGIPMETYPHQALNGARQSYLVYKALSEMK